MPKKRSRRYRCKPPPVGALSRRRLGADGECFFDLHRGSVSAAPLFDSVDSDGGSPPPGLPDEPVMSSTVPRYHEIIASRLAELQLPVGDDGGSDLAGFSNLPSSEILQALTRKSFHDDDSRAALVEYQCHKLLSETQGLGRHSGQSDSAAVNMGSTCTEPDDVITKEEHMGDCELLGSRMTKIDAFTELDQEQTNQQHLKRALYLIKAALLLKGKPVDELDHATLESKYPPELIVENKYFFHYEDDSCFSWYFDSELCYKESLTDYQRLVLFNDGGHEYTSWSRYRAFYSTPEADRDYLRYWETIEKEIKWLEQYVLIKESSIEWAHKRSKAMFQAIRIAAGFPNMTLELAAYGFHEYVWYARIHLMFLKDLDGIFYEIWRRVNKDCQLCFSDALQQVYDDKLFPAHDRSMKYALTHGDSKMELVFGQCTKGLSDSVPEYIARKLIAQEILWTRGPAGTYEQYARKKLKIAELIGLIPKDKIAAA